MPNSDPARTGDTGTGTGTRSDRERGIEAWHILNSILSDLLISSRSFDIIDSTPLQTLVSRDLVTGFQRMFYFHLFLTLAKCAEFYDHYRRILPGDAQLAWKEFRDWVEKSRLRKFRNQYIGHIWDKNNRRPLRDNELLSFFDTIVGPDRDSFLRWVNNRAGNHFPSSVVAIVKHTRNSLQVKYSLAPPDILPSPIQPDLEQGPEKVSSRAG